MKDIINKKRSKFPTLSCCASEHCKSFPSVQHTKAEKLLCNFRTLEIKTYKPDKGLQAGERERIFPNC